MDGAADLDVYTSLLGLEEFEVVEVSADAKQKVRRLTIVPRMGVGLCPHCGSPCEQRHECFDRTVLDLPMGQSSTELIVRLSQFHCGGCDRFFTPHYRAIAEGMHATERLLDRMEQMIRFSDVANTARFFAVAEKTLERWYYEYLERKQNSPSRELQAVRSLGIDELSLKKSTGNSAPC